MKIVNLGSLNIDRVYKVGRFALPGETVPTEDFIQMYDSITYIRKIHNFALLQRAVSGDQKLQNRRQSVLHPRRSLRSDLDSVGNINFIGLIFIRACLRRRALPDDNIARLALLPSANRQGTPALGRKQISHKTQNAIHGRGTLSCINNFALRQEGIHTSVCSIALHRRYCLILISSHKISPIRFL